VSGCECGASFIPQAEEGQTLYILHSSPHEALFVGHAVAYAEEMLPEVLTINNT
jgi:hypothetical protein